MLSLISEATVSTLESLSGHKFCGREIRHWDWIIIHLSNVVSLSYAYFLHVIPNFCELQVLVSPRCIFDFGLVFPSSGMWFGELSGEALRTKSVSPQLLHPRTMYWTSVMREALYSMLVGIWNTQKECLLVLNCAWFRKLSGGIPCSEVLEVFQCRSHCVM
jgi:hypothetical protein